MPNLTGGKNYKKTKHSSEKPKYVEKSDDQLFGRVLQILGNRNTLVFCNDNEIRLCHIRGSIRKDMWINIGDIVLISIRELNDKSEKYQKGDILHKYEGYKFLDRNSTFSINLVDIFEYVKLH
jgi:translation initiation factor 1A